MAKTIKGNTIIEDNYLDNAIKSTELYEAALKDVDKTILKVKEDMKGLLKNTQGATTVTEINAVTAAYKKSSDAVKSAILLDQQLKNAQDDVVKGKIRLQQATATQKKLLTEEIALEDKQIGTLKRLNIENAKLRRERDGLNLSTKKGNDELIRINATLDKNNALIKKSSDLQKKQTLNVGNYGSAVTKLNSNLMQLGIGFSVFTTMREAFNTVVDFEKATASLSAITGAVGANLTELKGKVMDLATEMKISATDATKLFEIVGSQMPQLLKDADGLQKVAESAVILSKASGDTVEESTRALANVMNQFSLGADQAERTMNILAAGSLVGSAGIADVSEAMKNFGSVAAGANISVEQSVALIEVLGKFGVVGAESGTKLRGSILKLQQASFGYASGQFEVNDALAEAKKKMDSYGTALEQDAFLQKTFGAENISTGRILLANIGLFDEYTKGVTGTSVATEQAKINSDTMATVVKELGAAWDNLLVKWSEGTDVLSGVKTMLRFVADNLEEIIGWVFAGVKAWVLYKSTLTLVNNAGTGMIQMFVNLRKGADGAKFSLGTLAKGLGGVLGIAAVLIPLLWDAAKAIGEMFDRTTGLDRVTEKYNEKMDLERAKMDLLRTKVLSVIGDKSKMKDLITEINNTYGTTISNIEDEALMLYQLEKAYKAVNAQMEQKIMGQLIEEELTALYAEKRRIERELKDDDGMTGVYRNFLTGNLSDVTTDIAELNRELMSLDKTAKGLEAGGLEKLGMRGLNSTGATTAEDTDKEKKELDRLAELRRKNADYLILVENDLTQQGVAREIIETQLYEARMKQYKNELKMIEALNYGEEEYNKTLNEALKLQQSFDGTIKKLPTEDNRGGPGEIAISDAIDPFDLDAYKKRQKEKEDEEKKAADRRKKLEEESLALMRKMTDARAEEIQRRIDMEKTEVAASEEKINFLREQAKLGNTDAAESIKAEEIAKAKNQFEINQLEKKKKGLLATVAVLERASQLVNAGDSNPFGKAGTELSQLLSKIPGFFEGTEGTVADALGKPHLPGKDGYLTRVDGSEMIFNGNKTAAMQAAGLKTTSQVAQAALAYSNGVVNRSAGSGTQDSAIISELKAQTAAIKSLDIPEHQFRYDEQNKALVETIKTRNKVINNHYKQGGVFS